MAWANEWNVLKMPTWPKVKRKKANCDQMMWELELNELCFGACLEALASQIPVLGKFCMCNHGCGHLEWLQKESK